MPPENSGYMIAAYLVTAVVLVAYAVSLVRRARRALERVSRVGDSEDALSP